MLKINGAYGEGGGQILRTALSLSILTGKSFDIENIRGNRSKPGLRPQHETIIKIFKEICKAETSGVKIGSTHVVFKPGEIKGGEYTFSIGTAGSIPLAFQACILAFINTENPLRIRLTGGTDIEWSPTWDYFYNVYLSFLKKIGLFVDVELLRRGYYPKGGGEAVLNIKPANIVKSFKFDEDHSFSLIKGIINISNLPDHISSRMKHTVIKTLLKKNIKCKISVDKTSSFSPGVGLTLWVETTNKAIGVTMTGEKGITAEKIGKKVANQLILDMESGASVDACLFDQILPFMALSNNTSSCIVRCISQHAETNIWVLKQFLDTDFETITIGDAILVSC